MKKQFVTYKIALKLKELGFDEKCFRYYTIYYELSDSISDKYIVDIKNTKFSHPIVCSAPLWQQVIDWFRENYKIIIEPCIDINNLYEIHIYDGSSKYFINDDTEQGFYTYEEAREQAILKAIELCQNKK